MKEYIISFFEEFDYPAEARAYLLEVYGKLTANSEAWALIEAKIKEYEETDKFETGRVAEAAILASRASQLPEYAVHFLVYVIFSKHLRDIYAAKGVDMKIYHDSMTDMRIKLMECREVKGEWGSFVCTWFDRFFLFERFALGRLQFETEEYPADIPAYKKCGLTVKGGDTVINMHIPSGSRMPYEQVVESYKKAYDFFSRYTVDGKMVFFGHSWLFYHSMFEICEKGTNTYNFIKDFDVLSEHEDPNYRDAWRLFGVEYKGDPKALLANSGLRRNVVKWLDDGKKMGEAYAVLVFDGEKVINK